MMLRTLFLALFSLLAMHVSGRQLSACAGDTVRGEIVFPLCRYRIPSDNAFIIHLRDDVLPEINSRKMCLKHVRISGAASPDGKLQRNKALAEKRNKVLLDTISRLISLPADRECIQLEVVNEDYHGLVEMMKVSDDPYYNKVKDIVDRYADSDDRQLKAALRAIDRGRFWKYITVRYCPELRKATLELIFAPVVEEPVVEEPIVEEPVVEEVTMLSEVSAVAVEPVEESPIKDTIVAVRVEPVVMPQQPADTIAQPRERIHLLSLKSNLLYDVFWMPQFGMAPVLNIHAEYYPLNGHFTYGLGFQSGYYHRWSKCKFFQIRDYKLEARYYLHPARDDNAQYLGTYISAYLHADKFGFGFGPDKGWQGEGGGGGLSIGYVKNISKNHRWRLEGFAALGFFVCRYDPYVYGNPVTGIEDGDYYYDYTGNVKSFKRRNHMFRNFIPQAGINITYDLLYRKTKSNGKKGVSFKRYE